MIQGVIGADYCLTLTGKCPTAVDDGCWPCAHWPPPAMQFTYSGRTFADICCRTNGQFGINGFRLGAGINDCLNRTFLMPLVSISVVDNSEGRFCTANYAQLCTITLLPGLFLYFAANVQMTARHPSIGSPSVLLEAQFIFLPSIADNCSQEDFFRSDSLSFSGFNCSGPWTAPLIGTGLVGGLWTSPASVSISPAAGSLPAEITNCCTPAWAPCTPDAAPTANCVDGACVDPGDGTGELDPVTCAALCGTGVLCPTPPCGNGGDGDDGGITTACCPTMGRTVSVLMTGAIDAMFGIAWSNAFGVWAGSTPGCGTFLTATLECTTGEVQTFRFRLWCGGVLVVDEFVPAAIGEDHACGPFRRHFGVNITCGICSGAVTIYLNDGHGPAE